MSCSNLVKVSKLHPHIWFSRVGPKVEDNICFFQIMRSSQVSAPLIFSWAKKWRSNMFSSNLVDKIQVSVPLKKCNIFGDPKLKNKHFSKFCWKGIGIEPHRVFLSAGRKLKLHYFPGTFLRFGSFLRGALVSFPEVMKGSEEGTFKNVPNTSRRHCEAWALKVVNVLRCCLHCSLCFCFFVLLQVFAGAPFSFA